MYRDFHFYIDLNWEDCVRKTNVLYFKELYELVELVHQHKATVFYSKKQLNEFLSQMSDLDADFTVSTGNKLDIVLENAKCKKEESFAFELCFAKENTTIHYIDNILSSLNQHDKIAIISFSNNEKSFLSVKSGSDYNRIDYQKILTTNDIIDWISRNKTRLFNKSQKHGEKAKDNWKNSKKNEVSQLLCSSEDAQKLLDTAIPCFLEREKNLYNFDHANNTFIEFFFEGNNPQNQWHGFHLETTEWTKVPDYIRKYFGK
jgi:hypothetical protein